MYMSVVSTNVITNRSPGNSANSLFYCIALGRIDGALVTNVRLYRLLNAIIILNLLCTSYGRGFPRLCSV